MILLISATLPAYKNFNLHRYYMYFPNNFIVCVDYVQHCEQQFKCVSTMFSTARSNFNLCPRYVTFRPTISTVDNYLQHCAQQLKRLSFICNSAQKCAFVCVSTNPWHCVQPYEHVCSLVLSGTLRTAVATWPLPATSHKTFSQFVQYL